TGAGLVAGPVDALAREHVDVLRQLAAAGPTPAPAGSRAVAAVVLAGRCPWDADWSARPPVLLAAPRGEPAARAAPWAPAYGRPAGAARAGPRPGAGAVPARAGPGRPGRAERRAAGRPGRWNADGRARPPRRPGAERGRPGPAGPPDRAVGGLARSGAAGRRA